MTIDPTTLIVIGAGAIGWLIVWLLKHGARLTGTEVRIQALADAAAIDRQRADANWSEVRASLTRIEDKLDRKADR
ncbi:hypothetical protein LQ772_06725 [Frateuria edaphi]|uniref:hypothetical protein n=1 Tax=Frateuria edaphi TaxID=2898793 RepID=UPI001E2A41A7|nr:hypothetical protein [Frateuria edaphi]UGB46979.1 hypothetical protein LQ772_06725 [Frateuria edaphi]